METRGADPKQRILVELEADAVLALLNDSFRHLKQWATWEPHHNALAPLRLRALKPVETSMSGPPMYRIELRCEQAEALRERCEELAGILLYFCSSFSKCLRISLAAMSEHENSCVTCVTAFSCVSRVAAWTAFSAPTLRLSLVSRRIV